MSVNRTNTIDADTQKVIAILGQKLADAELQNAILLAKLQESEDQSASDNEDGQ